MNISAKMEEKGGEKMDQIEYQGKKYKRVGNKWTDSSNCVVPEGLQRDLNFAYLQSHDISDMSVKELIAEGDKFKDSTSYFYAIRCYERAAEICSKRTLQFLLPRLSSCYRKKKTPQKTVEMFAMAKSKYGEDFITPVLLTTVAAAYCDLKEYENAMRCCKWAMKKNDGELEPALLSVYARIKKEAGIS